MPTGGPAPTVDAYVHPLLYSGGQTEMEEPVDQAWKVTSQREGSVFGPAGTTEGTMIVTFQTGRGVVGTITVPLSEYTADNVRGLIQTRVDAIDAVHDLGNAAPGV
jgi:hypothetical protein